MLLLRLPLRSVDTVGQVWTLAFYALNPPLLVVQLLAPYEAHALEQSNWPLLQYPIAALTSLCWWLGIVWFMFRRHQRALA
jgi:hypothetical protein